jgi:hypothetical protein
VLLNLLRSGVAAGQSEHCPGERVRGLWLLEQAMESGGPLPVGFHGLRDEFPLTLPDHGQRLPRLPAGGPELACDHSVRDAVL